MVHINEVDSSTMNGCGFELCGLACRRCTLVRGFFPRRIESMRNLTPNFFIVVAIIFLLTAPGSSQEHREVTNRAGTGSAGKITVRLGSSSVVIPAPEGYEEATSQFERVKARFSETEAPGNEMLAAHLMSSDCDLLRRNQEATYQQYTKVSVLRTAKEQVFTQADLAAVVSEFRKNGTSMMDPDSPRMKAVLERVAQALKKPDLGMSQPVNMGEFEVSPNIYSVMLLMTYKSSSGAATPVLATMSYMRLQQRLVYLFTYRQYTSRSDVEILRSFAKTWTGKVLSAN